MLVPPEAEFKFAVYRGSPVVLKADASAPAGPQPFPDQVAPVRVSDYIIPEPRKVHKRDGKEPFRINADTKLVIDDDAGEADMWTVEEINAAIEKLGGNRLGVVHSMALGKSQEAAKNAIVIGETGRNSLLKSVCDADSIARPASGNEAYAARCAANADCDQRSGSRRHILRRADA